MGPEKVSGSNPPERRFLVVQNQQIRISNANVMNPSILTSALPGTFCLPLFSQNLRSAYSRRRVCASDRYDLQRTSPQRSGLEQPASLQSESAFEQDLNYYEERILQRRDLVIGLFALATFVGAYHPMNAYALG